MYVFCQIITKKGIGTTAERPIPIPDGINPLLTYFPETVTPEKAA